MYKFRIRHYTPQVVLLGSQHIITFQRAMLFKNMRLDFINVQMNDCKIILKMLLIFSNPGIYVKNQQQKYIFNSLITAIQQKQIHKHILHINCKRLTFAILFSNSGLCQHDQIIPDSNSKDSAIIFFQVSSNEDKYFVQQSLFKLLITQHGSKITSVM